ncbi:uncharacterized protein LOC128213514 [Mya arenaria]|uniref:uncharacterized protein LOC128213514 n=1 Tax=Mya arenaria TaxID=6604 RepID=UPI0022E95AEF|nr:uncharacterized protein LOC128213514 [Mya arenaria]XP_052775242.1 uncharacterized protein LOC128213514 [Mya arenaria]XP_052775244.1 uncharacterized protein LOC128213514 [Mya arenaria]XP_052775245.1 uncharacterized protein LOC128213514 [Mya arenaria]
MENPPDFYRIMSLRLSRALSDIGVNRWMVRRRRRTFLMIEASRTINDKLQGLDITCFHFGSQSEGTTTPGLNSDIDTLSYINDTNIMSSWSEWEAGRRNMLMVKEETCSPQHYLLQEIRHDSPEPVIHSSGVFRVVDSKGRVLFVNTLFGIITQLISIRENLLYYSSGPSHSSFKMYDFVFAYWCRSLPQECHAWFKRPRPGHWPTPEVLRDVRKCGCFLVPDGYFDSYYRHVEWRISPSLIERILMFTMKTLQLKCYVVLKILKSHVINPLLDNEGKLTSFHCKTALLFAAERLPSEMWRENRLMECIVYCLKLLLGWTKTGMCPHFIVAGVNLFHGKFTSRQLANLSKILSNIIDTHLVVLAYIQADDLGNRMFSKNIRTVRYSEGLHISTKNSLCRWLSVHAHFNIYKGFQLILSETSDFMSEDMISYFGLYLTTVRTYVHELPFPLRVQYFDYVFRQVLSVFASTAASCCIRNGSVVPRNILCLFESSLDTDVASSRLKLASFLVCHNELERAADVLNDVERRYDDSVQAVCACHRMDPLDTEHHKPLCTTSVVNNDDVLLTNKTALCVRYLRQEAFCAPPILHYEMVRGLGEDINHRNVNERYWMNWAVVDSLPYLYYLQYLTFRDLGQRGRQRQALMNLYNCFRDASRRSQLYHGETYLNLVGHCMEMEGQPERALQGYRISVEGMPRNNAAHWHIYRLNHGYEI